MCLRVSLKTHLFLSDRHLRPQHGHGPCNIFILDTSSSLGEDGFKEMKETFISIIDGKNFLFLKKPLDL